MHVVLVHCTRKFEITLLLLLMYWSQPHRTVSPKEWSCSCCCPHRLNMYYLCWQNNVPCGVNQLPRSLLLRSSSNHAQWFIHPCSSRVAVHLVCNSLSHCVTTSLSHSVETYIVTFQRKKLESMEEGSDIKGICIKNICFHMKRPEKCFQQIYEY